MEMVFAIAKEISLQKNYLQNKTLDTIYLGGGTPSLLTFEELSIIFDSIKASFEIKTNAEITLEANPDDLSEANLTVFRSVGINRLSIGLQSFYEEHLRLMNRAHTAKESLMAVQLAKKAGFDNLSIDLIYGIPANNHEIWKQDLETALKLGVSHISAYCLTIEPKTTLGTRTKQKKFVPAEDEFAAEQFEILLETLTKNGFEQYEISNFAKKQKYSKHNTSYWLQEEYLGVGPSAHSFNLTSRQSNISNNSKYLTLLDEGKVPFSKEILTNEDIVNEYLLTGLRTIWGCEIDKIEKLDATWMEKNIDSLNNFQVQNLISILENKLILTPKGRLFADKIVSDLFI